MSHRPASVALILLGAAAVGLIVSSRPAAGHKSGLSPEAVAAATERMDIDRIYGSKPREAKRRYARFVQENASSPNAGVRDQVGAARLRIGYLAAKQGDYLVAREIFLEASEAHKDSKALSPEFGGICDQAAYQAAVCLVAEGKDAEARGEFLAFMKERPLSPLVHAAYRRLQRLGDPKAVAEAESLLQKATRRQEERIRFESSVCGPKVIAYLLHEGHLRTENQHTEYKAIAELCGTSSEGTTLEGMRKGLEGLGIRSFGVQLNRQDLASAPMPAILLDGEHYLALLHVGDSFIDVYDPVYGSRRRIDLRSQDEPTRLWTLLTFSPPSMNRS